MPPYGAGRWRDSPALLGTAQGWHGAKPHAFWIDVGVEGDARSLRRGANSHVVNVKAFVGDLKDDYSDH